MTDATPGPAASALDGIRADLRTAADGGLSGIKAGDYLPAALVRHCGDLLKAVDAALSRHRPVIRKQGHPAMCEWDNRRWPCPEVAAITAALAGEADDEH